MLTVRSTINISSQTVPPIIPVVQGDTGRAILFTLADFTIPAGATATYYVQKPSGEAVYNNATIDGNNILVELTAQSIIEKGDNYGQVRISSNGEVVTSFDFILLVKEFRGIDAVQSLTEMNIFDKAVEQASGAIDEVKTDALDDIGDAKEAALQEIEQTTGNFADDFSASATYAAGDYVMHSGQLYRFTANHAAGAWTGSDAEAVTVGEELTDLKAETTDLKEELTDYETALNNGYVSVLDEWEQGSINYASGEEQTSTSACRTIDYYEPTADTTVVITNAPAQTLGLRTYTSNGTYQGSTDLTNLRTFSAVVGYKYRVICASTGTPSSVTATFTIDLVNSFPSAFYEDSEKVSKTDVYIENMLDPDECAVNYRPSDSTGATLADNVSYSNYCSSPVYEVRSGETYIFNSQGYSYNIFCGDRNGKVKKCYQFTANTAFTIPDGIYYMRYVFAATDDTWKTSVMLCKGDTLPSEFLAYGNKAVKDTVKISNDSMPSFQKSYGFDQDKAYVLLNFDASETDNVATNGFFGYRKSLMDAYGLKGSVALTNVMLGTDFDTWRSETDRELYFQMLKEGWDFGLYTSVNADDLDETGWNTKLAGCVESMEALGICNVTGYHCAANNLNDDLLSALKTNNFKVVRNKVSSSGYNTSYYGNIVTDYRDIVTIGTDSIGSSTTAGSVKTTIDTAISNKSTLSLMAHLVIDTTESIDSYNCYADTFTEILAYLKEKQDEGSLKCITWRDLFRMYNPYSASENDYNRVLKMSVFAQ